MDALLVETYGHTSQQNENELEGKMSVTKKAIILVVAFAAFWLFLIGLQLYDNWKDPEIEMQTGTISVCRTCGKIDSNTITLKVRKSNSINFQPETIYGYCETCGKIDTTIKITTNTACKLCGKNYKRTKNKTLSKFAALKTPRTQEQIICNKCRYQRATRRTSGNYGVIWRGGGINLFSDPYGPGRIIGSIKKPGDKYELLDIYKETNDYYDTYAKVKYKNTTGWAKLYILQGKSGPKF